MSATSSPARDLQRQRVDGELVLEAARELVEREPRRAGHQLRSVPVADVRVPVAHPLVEVLRELRAIERHRLDLRLRVAHPLGERVERDVRARGNAVELLRRGLECRRRRHELVELLRNVGVLRPLHDGDRIHEHRRPARRDHVLHRNLEAPAERRDVGHVVERDQPFLPAELLVQHAGVERVLLGARVEAPEPRVPGVRRSELLDPAQNHRAENRPHAPTRQRIADDHLPLPLRIEDVVPVLRRVRRGHRVAVVRDYLRSEICAVPEIGVALRLGRNRGGPRRPVCAEQPGRRRAIEHFGRRAEPDIRLRVRGLAAQAVEHVLRAHVHPLHVHRRVRALELGLVVLEEILAVRRVDREHGAPIAAARGERERRDAREPATRATVHGDTARPAGVWLTIGGPSRFTKSRAAPGTPAGSCRKNASVV